MRPLGRRQRITCALSELGGRSLVTRVVFLGRTPRSPVDGCPLRKVAPTRRFYADVYLLIQWAMDGRELKASTGAWRAAKGWGDHWRAQLHNADCYGRPGITWPARSQVGFSARAMGSGGIFGHKGPTVFISKDEPDSLAGLLAIMNSKMCLSILCRCKWRLAPTKQA